MPGITLSAELRCSVKVLCLAARGTTYFLFWRVSTLSGNIKSSISSKSSLVQAFIINEVDMIQYLKSLDHVCNQHYRIRSVHCYTTKTKSSTSMGIHIQLRDLLGLHFESPDVCSTVVQSDVCPFLYLQQTINETTIVYLMTKLHKVQYKFIFSRPI